MCYHWYIRIINHFSVRGSQTSPGRGKSFRTVLIFGLFYISVFVMFRSVSRLFFIHVRVL